METQQPAHRVVVIASTCEGVCSFPLNICCSEEDLADGRHRYRARVWALNHPDIDETQEIIAIDGLEPIAEQLFATIQWDSPEIPTLDLGAGQTPRVITDLKKESPMTAQFDPQLGQPATIKKPEQVLVLPTKLWRDFFAMMAIPLDPLVEVEPESLLGAFAEDLVANESLVDDACMVAHGFRFEDRNDALENNINLLQLIPYISFLTGSKGLEEIFVYQRSKGQGEARLLKKWSIGVGGHCNPLEGSINPYRDAVMREVQEELGAPGTEVLQQLGDRLPPAPVAFLYDVSEPVNAVHLGGVHLIKAKSRIEFDCEASMANPGWEPLMKAYSRIEDFEPWSRLVLNWLVSKR